MLLITICADYQRGALCPWCVVTAVTTLHQPVNLVTQTHHTCETIVLVIYHLCNLHVVIN